MEIQQWTTRQGGLDGLERASAPMPAAIAKDHVLVKIHTVSLNYRDTEVCMGLYNHHRSIAAGAEPPLVPCSDMCGTVVAVGEKEEKDESIPFAIGDRVVSVFNHLHRTGHMRPEYLGDAGLGLPLDGVLQSFRVFPSAGLLPAPAYLSDAEACCLPIASVTAWMSLQETSGEAGQAGPGKFSLRDKVVLLQGTGGVSMAGAQLAKAAGAAAIIVTSSSDAKLERVRALLGGDGGGGGGAARFVPINYKTTPRWADAVMAATDGNGADFILETGGAGTLRQSFDAVAFGGVVSCIGYLGGKTTKTHENDKEEDDDDLAVSVLALRRNMTLRGIMNGPRDQFEAMLAFYEQQQIQPVVDRVFAFEESPAALQYLYSGQHFGKVVIQVAAAAAA